MWSTIIKRILGYFWLNIWKLEKLVLFIISLFLKCIGISILHRLEEIKNSTSITYNNKEDIGSYKEFYVIVGDLLPITKKISDFDTLTFRDLIPLDISNSLLNEYRYTLLDSISTTKRFSSCISGEVILYYLLLIFENTLISKTKLSDLGFLKTIVSKANKIYNCYKLYAHYTTYSNISDKVSAILLLPKLWAYLHPGSIEKAWDIKVNGATLSNVRSFLNSILLTLNISDSLTVKIYTSLDLLPDYIFAIPVQTSFGEFTARNLYLSITDNILPISNLNNPLLTAKYKENCISLQSDSNIPYIDLKEYIKDNRINPAKFIFSLVWKHSSVHIFVASKYRNLDFYKGLLFILKHLPMSSILVKPSYILLITRGLFYMMVSALSEISGGILLSKTYLYKDILLKLTILSATHYTLTVSITIKELLVDGATHYTYPITVQCNCTCENLNINLRVGSLLLYSTIDTSYKGLYIFTSTSISAYCMLVKTNIFSTTSNIYISGNLLMLSIDLYSVYKNIHFSTSTKKLDSTLFSLYCTCKVYLLILPKTAIINSQISCNTLLYTDYILQVFSVTKGLNTAIYSFLPKYSIIDLNNISLCTYKKMYINVLNRCASLNIYSLFPFYSSIEGKDDLLLCIHLESNFTMDASLYKEFTVLNTQNLNLTNFKFSDYTDDITMHAKVLANTACSIYSFDNTIESNILFKLSLLSGSLNVDTALLSYCYNLVDLLIGIIVELNSIVKDKKLSIVNKSFSGQATSIYVYLFGNLTSCNLVSSAVLTATQGGVVLDLSLVSSCKLNVSDGGKAYNITANNNCTININSNGVCSNLLVYSTTLNVGTKGLLNTAKICSTGLLAVYKGGSAYNILASGKGIIQVLSGGTASIKYLPFAYTGIISSTGATITYLDRDMNVYYGNSIVGVASSANQMTNLSVQPSYSALVYSGGLISNACINSNGYLNISVGGSALVTSLNNRGYVNVYSGGTATLYFNPFGYQGLTSHTGAVISYLNRTANIYYGNNTVGLVSSANQMTNLSVQPSYSALVYSGGFVITPTLHSGGNITIYTGGTVIDPKVSDHVRISGGTMTGADVYSHGFVLIFSGGTANSATLSSGATVNVGSKGVINAPVIRHGATLTVYSGGTATMLPFNPFYGSSVVSSTGAVISYLNRTANIYYGNNSVGLVSSANQMNNLSVQPSYSALVYSGGVLSTPTVSSGGSIIVSSGGVTNTPTISSGGILITSSRGTVNTAVIDGGQLNIASGSLNTCYVWNSGTLYLYQGATANNIQVNSTCKVYASGGTLNSTTISSGGSLTVYSKGTANTTVINRGTVAVSAGKLNTCYILNLGTLDIYQGGVVNNVLLNNYCKTYIHGGTLNSITINTSGSMFVSSGGTANNTVISTNGKVFVSSGGTANNTVISTYGSMFVSSGGAANSVSLLSNGYLDVNPGGTALVTNMDKDGMVYVYSGGTATLPFNPFSYRYLVSFSKAVITYLNRNMNVYYGNNSVGLVSSANSMTNLSVQSGYSALVYSGGFVSTPTISAGGVITVLAGGSAKLTFNPFYGSSVVSHTGAVITYLNRDMNVYYGNNSVGLVSSANSMTNLSVQSGYSALVYSGGVISSTYVQKGNITIYAGGTVIDPRVLGHVRISGGTMTRAKVDFIGFVLIFSGGTANSATLSSGATVNVGSKGVINTPVIRHGATLTVYSGGTATMLPFNPFYGSSVVSHAGAAISYLDRDMNVYYGNNSGGLVSSANQMTNLTIWPYLSALVYSGGVLSTPTISSGGLLAVHLGGTVNTAVIDGGQLSIASGSLNTCYVWNSGTLYLYQGTTANNIQVNSTCKVYASGGTLNSVTLISSGTLYLLQGVTASNIQINKECDVYANEGTLNSITITSHGRLYGNSKVSAYNMTISKGLVSFKGGYCSGIDCLLLANFILDRYGSAADVTIGSKSSMTIMSGYVTDIHVNPTGSAKIMGNGSVGYIRVSSGGLVSVCTAGRIINADIEAGGYMVLLPGSYKGNTYVYEKLSITNSSFSGSL